MVGELLNTRQAAEYLQASPGSIRRWAEQGKLPSKRTPGGQLRFKKSDLEKVYADPEDQAS